MNKSFFKPNGLFCLIMTFEPGNGIDSQPMDLSSSIMKSATQLPSRIGNFRSSAGQIVLPQAAPLIFPALDKAADAGNTDGFKGFEKTVRNYFDRRAQAKHVSFPFARFLP